MRDTNLGAPRKKKKGKGKGKDSSRLASITTSQKASLLDGMPSIYEITEFNAWNGREML
jgi:hypothetical protein